jgi:hypothetical protein
MSQGALDGLVRRRRPGVAQHGPGGAIARSTSGCSGSRQPIGRRDVLTALGPTLIVHALGAASDCDSRGAVGTMKKKESRTPQLALHPMRPP